MSQEKPAKPRKGAHRRRGRKPMRPPGDFVARLFAGESYQCIAEAYEVDRNTVSGWSDLPDVVSELRAMRAERQAASLRALEALQAPAIATAVDLLTEAGPMACPTCRVGTAMCSDCGRPIERPVIADAVRLRTAELVMERTGLPKREQVEHLGQAPRETGAGDDADIIAAAMDIARDRNRPFLVAGLSELFGEIRNTKQEKSA